MHCAKAHGPRSCRSVSHVVPLRGPNNRTCQGTSSRQPIGMNLSPWHGSEVAHCGWSVVQASNWRVLSCPTEALSPSLLTPRPASATAHGQNVSVVLLDVLPWRCLCFASGYSRSLEWKHGVLVQAPTCTTTSPQDPTPPKTIFDLVRCDSFPSKLPQHSKIRGQLIGMNSRNDSKKALHGMQQEDPA